MQMLAEPRTVTDATEIVNNPGRYRDRPSLLHLARLVLISQAGATPRQTGPRAGLAAPVRIAAKIEPGEIA